MKTSERLDVIAKLNTYMRITEVVLPPHPDEIDDKMHWNDQDRYYQMHQDIRDAKQKYLLKAIDKKSLIKLDQFGTRALIDAGIIKKHTYVTGYNSAETYFTVEKDVKIRYGQETFHIGEDFGHIEWDPT